MTRMILAALAALAIPACAAAPAAAQTVAGCGTVAIARADRNNAAKLGTAADCFAKAKAVAAGAEDARRARIAALAPKPTPTPTPAAWTSCAGEFGMCRVPGEARVRYGAGTKFVERLVSTGSVACENGVFGDPAPGVSKACSYQLTGNPTVGAPAPAPTPTPVPTPTPAPPVAEPPASIDAARRAKLGVNIAGYAWWGGEQTFSNLAFGQAWRNEAIDFKDLTRDELDAAFYPRAALLGAKFRPTLTLTPPAASRTRDVEVTCTWKGTGVVGLDGNNRRDLSIDQANRRWVFMWLANTSNGRFNYVKLLASDPADPIRDLDCREAGSQAAGIFSKQTIDYYAQFGVLRMLDANGVNGNGQWRWATRTQPGDITQGGSDGLAIEHQMELARLANASPWINVSLNADPDYVRREAALVHELLPAGRKVYVELANEVWNYVFPASAQLRDEGKAAGLAPGDDFKAGLLRFAQRNEAFLKIWTEVFADRPGDLVRVLGTQTDNTFVTSQLLGGDHVPPSRYVDAIAIAPYFGAGVTQAHPNWTADQIMPVLRIEAASVLTRDIGRQGALAKSLGKALIAYEAGQHVVDPNRQDLVAAINRHPLMGAIYGEYLRSWREQNDGLMVLFNASGAISSYGAWGLREAAGQPITETPKLKAVQDYLAGR